MFIESAPSDELSSGHWGRSITAWIAALIGAALTCLAATTGYVTYTFADSGRFAQRFDSMRHSPGVATEVSSRLSKSLINNFPPLVAAKPQIDAASDVVVASDAFGPPFVEGVKQFHAKLIDPNGGTAALRITGGSRMVLQELAKEGGVSSLPKTTIPVDQIAQVGSQAWSKPLVQALRSMRATSWTALGLGLFLLAGLLAFSRNHRRALRRVGVALVIMACAEAIAVGIGNLIAPTMVPVRFVDALGDVWQLFVWPVLWWIAAVAAVGALLWAWGWWLERRHRARTGTPLTVELLEPVRTA